MLRTLKYGILITVTFLWALNVFRPLFEKLAPSGIFPDSFRYGDLYRLSDLPDFKEGVENYTKRCDVPLKKNEAVDLYVIGDSFLEQIGYLMPQNTHGYTFVHWSGKKDITLDTTKRNILIVQTVERSVINRFLSVNDNFSVTQELLPEEKGSGFVQAAETSQQTKPGPAEPVTWSFRAWAKTNVQQLIMKDFDQRADDILFSSDFFLFFKEIKAMLNLKLFDRVNEKIVISEDRKAIFFNEEASVKEGFSAFSIIDQDQIKTAVSKINRTRDLYLSQGFDEVYLSVIPNKVTILDPEMGVYNHMLERVYEHPDLAAPVIDVYKDLKKREKNYYLHSDSHWNCNGIEVWVKKVNETIR